MPPATKTAHHPDTIARLQQAAARSPAVYRLRLVVLALGGDLALTAIEVLPWAAPIGIGVLWINTAAFYWLGGAGIVFLVWLFRPTFRFEGRALAAEEAPDLYTELERLKKELRVPVRIPIYLDDSFNAGALETRGLFGLVGTKRALILGVPLLAAVSREQALGVIAHELGHFSRRHGRLGHWLYRAQVGVARYAHYFDDDDAPFYRATAWYARKFVPYFSARCFVHSRQCEYEADKDAASAVGAGTVAEALTRISVIGRLWEEHVPRQIADWQREHPEPPADFYERFERFAKEGSAATWQGELDEAVRAPASWHDTHPSLAERLRALNEPPVLGEPAQSAGASLFGEHWAKLCAEYNAKWLNSVRGEWLFEHLRLRHIVQPLVAADEAAVRNWSPDARLARAQALRESEPARGRIELDELQRSNPSHKRIRFAYAAALLEDNDDEGIAIMESLAREDAAFRVAAFARVLAFYRAKGDTQQIERWSRWLKQISASLGQAVSSISRQAEAGEGRPSSLPAGEQAVLEEAVRRDPCVVKAWILEGDAQLKYAPDRPSIPVLTRILVLAVDLAEAKRRDEDEESVAERYEVALHMLTPPDQVPMVRTYLTTEIIPEAFVARAEISLTRDAREEPARAA